jgi:hypothetical protein
MIDAIHSLSNYLFTIKYVPGTGNSVMNKSDVGLAIKDLPICGGRQVLNYQLDNRLLLL